MRSTNPVVTRTRPGRNKSCQGITFWGALLPRLVPECRDLGLNMVAGAAVAGSSRRIHFNRTWGRTECPFPPLKVAVQHGRDGH